MMFQSISRAVTVSVLLVAAITSTAFGSSKFGMDRLTLEYLPVKTTGKLNAEVYLPVGFFDGIKIGQSANGLKCTLSRTQISGNEPHTERLMRVGAELKLQKSKYAWNLPNPHIDKGVTRFMLDLIPDPATGPVTREVIRCYGAGSKLFSSEPIYTIGDLKEALSPMLELTTALSEGQ